MVGGYITVLGTGITLASGAVSSSATIPKTSNGQDAVYIRIAATAAACVRIGAGAQTAVTTDLQVQPGDAVVLQLPRGLTTIACIAATASTGIVQVSALDNA